jgi:hypothetical protein
MHVLAWSQGVAALANAFQDEKFIKHEVEKMYVWLKAYVTGEETNVRYNA